MKRPALTFTVFSLCALGLAGCGSSSVSSPYLKSAARAVLVAQAYERGEIAARGENAAKIEESVAELRKLGAIPEALMLAMRIPPTEAEKEVDEGARADLWAQLQTGKAKDESTKKAAAHYRKALQLQPNFTSRDYVRLNFLGYFLADRGSTAADFKQAETLTRQSVQVLDELIKAKTEQGTDTKSLQSMRSSVRDSVAWALYRQRRFDEALKEQQEAIREAKESGLSVSPELDQHLTAILKAKSKGVTANKLNPKAADAEPLLQGAAGSSLSS